MLRRWPLIVFVVYALACCFAAHSIFGAFIGVAPDTASIETGYWAAFLRVMELLFLALGTGSVLLLIEQLNQQSRWNRRLSYHQFFPEIPSVENRDAFIKLAKDKNIDSHGKGEALTDAMVTALNEPDAKLVVQAYLNDFEEFCAAVRRGLIDEDYGYDLEVCRVTRAWLVFQPWIQYLRRQVAYVGAYCELEALAKKWDERQKRQLGTNAHPAKV